MCRNLIVSSSLALFVTLISGPRADAVLGGRADTISADYHLLKASSRATTSGESYTVEELVSDATVVREYVSAAGVVFGITWNGYAHPDLKQVLGSYWGEYSTLRQKTSPSFGRKRQRLASDNLVVERWGHMRNLQGRAYVPSLIPNGVSLDEIK